MFVIEWKEEAIRELEKLERNIALRIYRKVEELKNNPFSMNIKRLKGVNAFRLRIGDYRAIFEVEKDTISILKVGHRRNIYN
ncbi:MAG: type II toxin-antitoxin system RelE/ParE family toxin [Nanoarchaeota archaeon]